MFSHDFPIWMRDDQYFYRGLIAIHLLSAPGCWDSQSARTWACWRTTPADWSLYMAVWTGFSVDVPTWLKFNHIESYMLFHVIHIICVYIYILYIYIHGIYIYTYIYIYISSYWDFLHVLHKLYIPLHLVCTLKRQHKSQPGPDRDDCSGPWRLSPRGH